MKPYSKDPVPTKYSGKNLYLPCITIRLRDKSEFSRSSRYAKTIARNANRAVKKSARQEAKDYIRAEDVIGVRNPEYDEDNILAETIKQFRLGK